MTATLRVYQGFEFIDGTLEVRGGSRSLPSTIDVDGKVKDWKSSVAATSSITVWEASNSSESVSNFDFCMIESDINVIAELTVDANNSIGTKTFAIEVQAGKPQMLLSDDAIANFTTDSATGTEDQIEKIRIRNANTTSSATVRVVLIT